MSNLTTHARRRAWTDAEDRELKARIGWDSPSSIAHSLGRSVNSIIVRSKRLGISRSQFQGAIYSARDVGKIFGIDAKTVSHVWIRSGALVGERSFAGAGKHRRWRIHTEAIETFIRDSVGRYDRHRIAKGTYWRELADRAQHDLLTAEQAARRLNVCTTTVYRHLHRGWLPGTRVRGGISWQGDWRIRAADLALFRARKLDSLGNQYRKRARSAA